MRTFIVICLLLTLAVIPVSADKKKSTPEKPDVAADINKPAADARKIEFDTTEGTWMNVDISPDGSTLIFDLLGDIYALPVTGGEATVLSSGPAYDTHPRYSPDGRTIAFTSDRGGMENVWLMDADGKNPRILTEDKSNYLRSAVWTPDGNYLVIRKEDGTKAGIPPVELWMYHVRGGSGIKLTSKEEMNNSAGPVVSRDGRYIYFARRRGPFSYIPNISFGLWDIVRYDLKTAETDQLTGGYGGAVRPAISPDGKTLVYVSRRDHDVVLIERNLSTGSERMLVGGLSRDEQEGFGQMDLWPNYTFTPDGGSLIYWNYGKIQKLDLKSLQKSEIPFRAHVVQHAAPRVGWQEKMDMGPVQAKILRWPDLSPDGRWLTFSAFGRIWLQEIGTGKTVGAARRLIADSPSLPKREYSPAFSPDGKWIAYVTWSDSEGGHLWKVAVGDSAATPQKLTTAPGHYINPVWSPKGDKLLLIRGSGLEFRGRQPEEENNFEIRIISAAGGEPELVSSINIPFTFRFHPEAYFNRDGSRIYFRDTLPPKPNEEQKSDLISLRLDGTDKKRHLRFPSVGDIVPSPDERWVLFTSRDNVYVAALPSMQLKEPPEVGPKEGSVPVWRLSDEAGGYARWSDNGKTITWSLGNRFHRLPLDAALKFVEEQKQKAAKKDEKESKDKSGGKESEEEKKEESKVPKSEAITIDVRMPRSEPSGAIVFRGARVITMKGEEVLENADVVVTNNRISSVSPSGTVNVPSDAKVMDASGKTIIPGLIDTHAHLHYSGFELHPDNKWEYIANLAYGVTTTYDPSAPSLDVFAQAEMVEAGLMIGPRIYSSGDVLYGGQPFDIYAEVTNQQDAIRQVKRMKAYGARMIKVYQQPRREQRLWFAEACRREKMLLTAEGAGELHTDITMALDGYTAFEHALPVELNQDVVELIARTNTYYTPTLLVAYGGPWGELYFRQEMNPHSDPKLNRFVPHFTLDPLGRRYPWYMPEEYHFPTVARGVAEILRAGGNIAMGAHGQQQGLGIHWEIWAMAGEGQPEGKKAMTPMEALRSSTILAADKLGFAPDLGSIEANKLADFLVLDANPLEDIRNTVKIKWVVKNGEVYDADTMRQEWPQQRDRPAFFWSKK